ncbi:MarR family transcriptional regulator [Methylobacterium sp. E-041]|uniref:MarR family winged helix-turn-helix transcriptional regulator n=1 Tax=unclassified Methylobacterium TaxID=2615210 RepID=UPI001FBB6470|nr:MULTISPECIES: MarR family transcriptional regulator [unclassified Methylobacterium]MCJ2039129.1 MarR family transcriptional regulator [Methylobacterium sp. J-059]MCJ2105606.1 MarR family transcriptional regulator [Methylobacterium sp. E-041]
MIGLQPLPDDPFQRLVISIFRLNGALIAKGDRLVSDLGLTSARWQVLGAAAAAPVPLTVASIARNMGLTRQTVRTTVRELEAAGFVRLAPNPHHQRAHLVVPTAAGEHAFGAAMERQVAWGEGLVRDHDAERITAAADLLQALLAQIHDARIDDETAEEA